MAELAAFHGSKSQVPGAELVSFLETLPEPHILCDRDYRILAANEAYRANWVDQVDVIGRKCFEVSHRYTVPCDQAGESCPLQRSLKSGQRERVLNLHYTSRGETFENIELPPIRDASGTIVSYVEKLERLPGTRGLTDAQGLIGRSPVFLGMMELVARVAPSDAFYATATRFACNTCRWSWRGRPGRLKPGRNVCRLRDAISLIGTRLHSRNLYGTSTATVKRWPVTSVCRNERFTAAGKRWTADRADRLGSASWQRRWPDFRSSWELKRLSD